MKTAFRGFVAIEDLFGSTIVMSAANSCELYAVPGDLPIEVRDCVAETVSVSGRDLDFLKDGLVFLVEVDGVILVTDGNEAAKLTSAKPNTDAWAAKAENFVDFFGNDSVTADVLESAIDLVLATKDVMPVIGMEILMYIRQEHPAEYELAKAKLPPEIAILFHLFETGFDVAGFDGLKMFAGLSGIFG